jgi:hypothetical protein
MLEGFPWLYALATGIAINLADVGCTLLFAAKPWEAELKRQGLEPSNITPVYYVLVNFCGGLLLSFVYIQFAKSLGSGVITAAIASILVWSITRIYGGGHVVMGQMPFQIFAVMSSGLAFGYVFGGQVFRLLIGQ